MRRLLLGRRCGHSLLFALVVLLATAGCGSDDDGGTGPGTGGGSDLPQDGSSTQVVGEFGLQALAAGSEIATQVVDWAAGLGPARASEPVWNEELQAWVWTVEEVLQFVPTIPQVNESRNWTFTVQYLDGETPQQSREGATSISAEVTLGYSLSRYASADDNRTMMASLFCNVSVGGLDTSELVVEVAGAGEVFADFTIGGEYTEFYSDVVSLNVEFTLVPGSCPVGDGVLSVSGTYLEWTWEGGAQYDWFLTRQERLASGKATLPCGN